MQTYAEPTQEAACASQQMVRAGMPRLDGEARRRLREDLQDRIAHKVSLMGGDVSAKDVRKLIDDLVQDAVDLMWPSEEELPPVQRLRLVASLSREFSSEFLGYGPLDPIFEEMQGVSEIMVNPTGITEDGTIGPHEVWVERDGCLFLCPEIKFEDNNHVNRIMNRICARQGRHLDDANPSEDATLPDGSRFNGTIYPVCPDGSTFNIRLFTEEAVHAEDLLVNGSCSKEELAFLAAAVEAKCSIVISGGTGAGKTTLLNVLSEYIPPTERIITIEDTCELLVHKHHRHVVRFEGRKPNAEGAGEVTLDDLLRSALRKRPDRIIVGECRGAEAYTMLEAMSTGHDGSLTTVHANDPVSALTRLVTLVKQGDATLSEDTVRVKIAEAVDMVVQVSRLADGSRKIVAIEEIGGYVDGHIQHNRVFEWDRGGAGEHAPCCIQPQAIRKKMEAAQVAYDPNWFLLKEGE